MIIINLIKGKKGRGVVLEEFGKKILLFALFVLLTLGVYYLIQALVNF